MNDQVNDAATTMHNIDRPELRTPAAEVAPRHPYFPYLTGQPALEIDLSPLPEDAVVYEVVYAPLDTPLLVQARDRELDTVDGLEMLVGQAALAFEILFHVEPPRDRDDELRALLIA